MIRSVAVYSFLALLTATTYGLEIGDSVPNTCFPDENGTQQCTDDFAGNVRVLLFNAGWCGPCNSHMPEVAKRAKDYHGKNVTFMSLSVDGWSRGSGASGNFLKEWKAKHSIGFLTLSSSWQNLQSIFPSPNYIPSDAIIDAQGKLAFREVNPGTTKLFAAVDDLLPNIVTIKVPFIIE